MSYQLLFTVPGAPYGKGSVRVGLFHGQARAFKDAKTEDYMTRVCFYAQAAMKLHRGFPWQGPVSVEVDLYLKRAKTLLGKKYPVDRFYAPRRPDLDNCQKALFDAMRNAGVYGDDHQIVQVRVSKWYCQNEPGSSPRTEVRCWETA